MNNELAMQNIDFGALGAVEDLSQYGAIDTAGMAAYTPKNTLSIKGKQFTFVNSDGSLEPASEPLKCVVMNVSPYQSQVLYARGYNPEEKNPDCSSANGQAADKWIDRNKNLGDGWNPNNCATCHFNQPGSAENGKGKACKASKSIAILPESKTSPMVPYVLNLPVTSIISFKKMWNELSASLRAQGRLAAGKGIMAPLELFVMSLSFRQRDEKNNVLSFPLIDFKVDSILPKEMWGEVKRVGQSDEVKSMLRIDEESISQHQVPQAKLGSTQTVQVPVAKDDDIPFQPVHLPPAPAPVAAATSGFSKPVASAAPAAQHPAASFGAKVAATPAKQAAPATTPNDVEATIDKYLDSINEVDDGFAL